MKKKDCAGDDEKAAQSFIKNFMRIMSGLENKKQHEETQQNKDQKQSDVVQLPIDLEIFLE